MIGTIVTGYDGTRWNTRVTGSDVIRTRRDAVVVRAREIVREAQELDEERHGEYDDPDSGGEGQQRRRDGRRRRLHDPQTSWLLVGEGEPAGPHGL